MLLLIAGKWRRITIATIAWRPEILDLYTNKKLRWNLESPIRASVRCPSIGSD